MLRRRQEDGGRDRLQYLIRPQVYTRPSNPRPQLAALGRKPTKKGSSQLPFFRHYRQAQLSSSALKLSAQTQRPPRRLDQTRTASLALVGQGNPDYWIDTGVALAGGIGDLGDVA